MKIDRIKSRNLIRISSQMSIIKKIQINQVIIQVQAAWQSIQSISKKYLYKFMTIVNIIRKEIYLLKIFFTHNHSHYRKATLIQVNSLG